MYLSLNRQRQNAIYLLVLYNKKVKNFFAKISFVGQQGTLFDVIMIYTKQSTPLAVDNSEMLVIGLSLKWRQLSTVCPLIDHGSRPMKS